MLRDEHLFRAYKYFTALWVYYFYTVWEKLSTISVELQNDKYF